MRNSLLHITVLVGLAGGCTGTGSVQYSGEVTTPELVEVSPGVQVVADYDEPIFYSDNFYWRNQGGVWYRSQYHTRGWVRYQAPSAVLSISQPSMYVHYHANAQVRDHREMEPAPMGAPGPQVRDHREMAPAPTPPGPGPEVRDHRETTVIVPESRHEEHREMKEEHKEAKEERKDAKEMRKDAKEERKDAKEERKDEKHERKHGH